MGLAYNRKLREPDDVMTYNFQLQYTNTIDHITHSNEWNLKI